MSPGSPAMQADSLLLNYPGKPTIVLCIVYLWFALFGYLVSYFDQIVLVTLLLLNN